ncbi:MAG TPA: hypothetical protein VLK58_25365 [Conexibacter sp.]|nr:hypothetical protein [Conexibacter sp.]
MEPNWTVAFYETARGEVPARDFLISCPTPVRATLVKIVATVVAAPPPTFAASHLWHAMHGSMKGLHEARDRHGDRLYRLFCVVDAKAILYGHDRRLVTLIDGESKQVRSEMPERVYRRVRGHRDDYLHHRRSAPVPPSDKEH